MKAASILGFLLLACASTVAPADTDVSPYEAMRGLQALQDRIALGDAQAQAAHAKAILRTARAFTTAKPAIWHDKRNARALVVYLFSGGDPSTIEDAIPLSVIAVEIRPLYEGALAYGRGDDAVARTRLMPIDPKTVASGLGGHLALIQATLSAADEPAKAIALLDVARLLEPGTLVEEAALRKEMSLIGASGDPEKFAFLARRYLSAFPRSIYAENFRQLVAKTVMQLGTNDTPEAAAKLGRLMSALDRGERRRLYLAIARESLLSGRFTMATLAGGEAAKLSAKGDADEARANVYVGAATIIGSHYEAGLSELTQVPPNRLDGGDRALRASALAVADIIRRPPRNGPGSDLKNQASAALVVDAERSIATAQALLEDPAK